MSNYKELSGNDLSHSYQPSDFQFSSTDDIKGTNDFLGQEEAIHAIYQGLKIEDRGYNLYICSENYQRMDDVIIHAVEKVASSKKACPALGYLNNFHHSNEPTLIELDTDTAQSLQDDLEELTAVILNDLPVMLDGEVVKEEQKAIIEEFEALKASYLYEISQQAEARNMQLKIAEGNIKFIPMMPDGKAMSLQEYENLNERQLDEVNERIEQLQTLATEVVNQINEKEDYYYELYEEVKHEAVLKEIGTLIRKLKNKYISYPIVLTYLNDVTEDLLKNIGILAISESEAREAKKDILPWMADNKKERMAKKYQLNIISMPPVKGAPVINDIDYPFASLSGKVLVDTDGNSIHCDYTSIQGGLFHAANHGYLILHMQNLLEKSGSWQSIKTMLRTGKIFLEAGEENSLALASGMLPQPVEADLKIILIGNQELYELLEGYDDTFKNNFKIRVDLNDEIACTLEEIEKLAKSMKKIIRKEKLPTVTTEGLLRMIAYSSRKLGVVDKFHGDINIFIDLLKEAKIYNKKVVDAQCIEKVIEAREKNDRLLQKRLEDTILDTTYLIDTAGSKLGQINGLAVYSIGEISCGRPIKITATAYRGKQGIVDIDGTAKLSGAIHTKGVSIISGFLGYHFAQDFPLSLNCNICIEQNYATIDGDSASSAELYAIISSLAEMPIYQHLAVTGSMNQFGDIQPIGGVNEKIEGFYKICKLRGLKGNEGVIIPKQNTKDLQLSSEVIESVKSGDFHIYEIATVWDGMELLMGTSKLQIIEKVYNKLKRYSE